MSPPAPVVCVGGIAVEDGCLLLVVRRNPPGAGRWSVPGGRVEPGETLAAAVVREVAEETGLDVFVEAVVGLAERIDGDHHQVIIDFRVSVPAPMLPRAGDDAVDVRWVPLETVRDLPLVDGLADFLEDHGILPRPTPFTI